MEMRLSGMQSTLHLNALSGVVGCNSFVTLFIRRCPLISFNSPYIRKNHSCGSNGMDERDMSVCWQLRTLSST